MRATIPTLIAAIAFASAPAVAAEGGEEPADIQAAIIELAQVAQDMRGLAVSVRLDTPVQCVGNGACVDGYLDAMSTTSLVFELESEGAEEDPKNALMLAEAIAFQAAFTYDAFEASGVARQSDQVCRTMRQAAFIGNGAVDIIREACDQGVTAQQCVDLEASPPIQAMVAPRCGAPRTGRIAD